MRYVYHDGGRKAAGFKGLADDCVCRAVAICTRQSYREVYDTINMLAKSERRKEHRSSARTGVHRRTTHKVMEHFGLRWTPTMGIGTGCTMHLRKDELPKGRIILNVSLHVTCVIDGVLYDADDHTRDGTRCVYGYWK